MAQLSGKKIALVATNGFEYSELIDPKAAFEDEGARVDVISPKPGSIWGETGGERAGDIEVDVAVQDAKADDYDALFLPGGVRNPDSLRLSPEIISFIRDFVAQKKPIAAICHGPWTLIDAGGVQGRVVTSWPSLRVDLENAGAVWSDQDVAVSENLVTSRKPADIPAFVRETIQVIAAI